MSSEVLEKELNTSPVDSSIEGDEVDVDFVAGNFIPEDEEIVEEEEEEEEAEETISSIETTPTKEEGVPDKDTQEQPSPSSFEDDLSKLFDAGVLEKDSPFKQVEVGKTLSDMSAEERDAEVNVLNSLLMKHFNIGLNTFNHGVSVLERSYGEIQKQVLRAEWGADFDNKFAYVSKLIEENPAYEKFNNLDGLRLLATKYDLEKSNSEPAPVIESSNSSVPQFDESTKKTKVNKRVYSIKELSKFSENKQHQLWLEGRVKVK